MATDKTRKSIAALVEARAQIETVLAGNADWLALRRAAAGASRISHELAFAADPLCRSWKHLNEAIGDLQAKEAQARDVRPGAVAEERRSAAEPDAPAPAPAQAQRPAARAEARSIELIHILRHIRDSAAQAGDAVSTARTAPNEAPASAATATDDARQAEAGDGAPGWEDLDVLAPEPEEASVTFVIRDEAQAASADGDAAQGEVEGGPLADRWATVGAEDCLYAPTGGEVEEAEVAIVSRPAERRSRKA